MNIRRHPVAAPLSLLILLFMWVPLIVVAVNSFNTQTIMAGWGGFTTHWYHLALHDQDVRNDRAGRGSGAGRPTHRYER